MSKKYELDEKEKNLFRIANKGTTLLTHTKRPHSALPKKRPLLQPADKPVNPFDLTYREDTEEIKTEDLLEFHRNGLQHKVLRKLRQGQYNIEAVLDMHGMKVIEARENLSYFLKNCFRKKLKVVLIIHGKGQHTGKPVLKNRLNQWLRQIDGVLAFCSATLRDGQAGSVYVLLKGGSSIE